MSDPGGEVVSSPPCAYVRGSHHLQLYADDSYLNDVLSRFVGSALAAGQAALVIATLSHRKRVENTLAARGVDLCRAAVQGRYVSLDANETLATFLVDGAIDEARFHDIICATFAQLGGASDGKDCRVAVFGELVALLCADGKPQEALRLEHLWNGLSKKYNFCLLCAYPVKGFDQEAHIELFRNLCSQHSDVSPSENYMALSSDSERLSTIAKLQQKAQVLEKKVAAQPGEQQFRLLAEAVQDYAIFMLDPKGNICSWNPGAERLKGYKAAEIIGRHFSCFYPQEDVQNGKPAWELVIAASEGRFEDEGWRIRKDGSRFWANVIITRMRDEAGTLVGFAKVTRDFTERMHAERALQKEVAERRHAEQLLQRSEASLRELSLHLLRTQDEERRRIGQDLHDSLGQYLAVLKMKLESASSLMGEAEDEAAQDLKQCVRLAGDCIREVRTVSYLLYPPMLEEMGLKSAIPWYLDGFSARSGIKTTFEVQSDFGRMPRDVELALFRVLQESLTNVHRHSGSQKAHVRLLLKGEMGILEIEDKGSGIPAQLLQQSGPDWVGAPGVGLRGMNERMRQLGGRLELASHSGGTTVSAIVPATRPAAAST